MEPLYTKQEILSAILRYMKTWDTGRPHLNEALELSELQAQLLGMVDNALQEEREEIRVLDNGYEEQYLFI